MCTHISDAPCAKAPTQPTRGFNLIANPNSQWPSRPLRDGAGRYSTAVWRLPEGPRGMTDTLRPLRDSLRETIRKYSLVPSLLKGLSSRFRAPGDREGSSASPFPAVAVEEARASISSFCRHLGLKGNPTMPEGPAFSLGISVAREGLTFNVPVHSRELVRNPLCFGS